MKDLRAIPKDLRVRIRLLSEDVLAIKSALSEQLVPEGSPSLISDKESHDVTMAYADWEALLGRLTVYMVEEVERSGLSNNELWRGKTEIANALIGLQEERIKRLEQGES